MKNKTPGILLTLFVVSFLFVSCGENTYTPKPRGFYRIALPEKKYQKFDTTFPYSFEYPVYSNIIIDREKKAEPFWINIEFPKFHATIYLSYKPVKNNLYEYFEDARNFVNKHIPKADDIEPIPVSVDSTRMYGIIYDIKGNGVASPYQFCLTDSTAHYLRAALYFNIVPNNDSLGPVLDFVKQDMDHMVKTMRWKDIPGKKK
ncbi:MAG: gliding motility lipoprotein GldD [Bacteroidota bacterium]